MKFRPLRLEDLALLAGMTPSDWNSPVEHTVERYLHSAGFLATVAEANGTIAGIGHVILFDGSAWLGNIIVRTEFRNQGIGTQITQQLVDVCKTGNPILLVATEQGFPVYAKLGFVTSYGYCFYRGGTIPDAEDHGIRQASETDFRRITGLDREATGESRDWILRQFFHGTYICESADNQSVTGFYMPHFGAGYIVAKDEDTGCKLLRYKLKHHSEKQICVPEENIPARSYLEQHAYKEYLRAPRMFLHRVPAWKPGWIYSRATGYCG